MISDKDRIAEKDDAKTVTSTQKETDKRSMSTGRPNIDDINKRNAEEKKQDRKSSYIIAGIVVLLIAVIVIAIYFLS
jgi:cobalamin biosynthesis Mg chelatase CobN